MSCCCEWSRKVAPWTDRALGLVFLAGAVLKALDINLFTVQIAHYGVIRDPKLVALAAIMTLAIETVLGILLLTRIDILGLVHLVVLLVLAKFTFLIAYGWVFSGLKDCGCFGPIEMSPAVSILKNIVLAALAVIGLRGRRDRPPGQAIILVGAALATLLAVAMTTYAFARLQPTKPVERPFAQFAFEIEGQKWDLGHGTYLVAMLSMTCEHCMASVPALNNLAQEKTCPSVIALCYEEKPDALDTFRDQTQPTFPLYSIKDQIRLFYSFLGDAPPRFYLVRDGVELAYWDESPPSLDEIRN